MYTILYSGEMANMSKRQHDKLLPDIIKKQTTREGDTGYYCNYCGAMPITLVKNHRNSTLVIDHINNKNSDNRLENLQLVCRGCNRRKNPSRPPVDQSLLMTHSENVNRKAEPLCRAKIINLMIDNGELDFDDTKNSLAEKYSISPITASRYISKLTSSEGPLTEEGGRLYWRDESRITKKTAQEIFEKYVENKNSVSV